jgi:4-hydroxybenzoate polyprenyltransferase
MPSPRHHTGRVADAQPGNWVDRYAPDWLKPYARVARWDRPLPLLLLFWPCGYSLALYTLGNPGHGFDWTALVLFLIGAFVMRGAGCTFNDIVDTDIDMKVARTRSRPIPSGQISKKQAAVFLALQALVGLVILIHFNWFTIWLGAASLVLIAIYPFMKRITWWPQHFLGLAFSYGALIGWASQAGSLSWPPVLLYAGAILWTIGYDTIYALQDIEDDALIGVKSTARLFGDRVRPVTALFYAGTLVLWLAAGLLAGMSTVFAMALIVPAAILFWQIATLDRSSPENARARFYANHWVGLTLTLALLAGKLLL